MNLKRVYISIRGETFKLFNLIEQRDGSLYIAAAATSFLQSESIHSVKFTYHASGKNWLTYQLRIDNSRIYTHTPIETLPTVDSISEITELPFDLNFQNINDINSRQVVLDRATKANEIKAGIVIETNSFQNLRFKFFILPISKMPEIEVRNPRLHYFTLELQNAMILATIVYDSWAGDAK